MYPSPENFQQEIIYMRLIFIQHWCKEFYTVIQSNPIIYVTFMVIIIKLNIFVNVIIYDSITILKSFTVTVYQN